MEQFEDGISKPYLKFTRLSVFDESCRRPDTIREFINLL